MPVERESNRRRYQVLIIKRLLQDTSAMMQVTRGLVDTDKSLSSPNFLHWVAGMVPISTIYVRTGTRVFVSEGFKWLQHVASSRIKPTSVKKWFNRYCGSVGSDAVNSTVGDIAKRSAFSKSNVANRLGDHYHSYKKVGEEKKNQSLRASTKVNGIPSTEC